jgi:hypothetical protein
VGVLVVVWVRCALLPQPPRASASASATAYPISLAGPPLTPADDTPRAG